jgi:hypothetical protein
MPKLLAFMAKQMVQVMFGFFSLGTKV